MRIVRAVACATFVPLMFALGACSTSKGGRAPADDTTVGAAGTAPARGGGYYLDDGPGHLSPADVAAIPDAVPRAEPVLARTARPYTVFGRTYTPMNALAPYRERGIASWYGRRYHGKPTSSGEAYDMYAMTAAHPTLAIPSYVRVTRVSNGRSVVVRVNDRGPFLQNRLIDLSYTAAAKLGFVEAGSAEVVVETITQFDAPGLPPMQWVEGGTGIGVAAASGSPATPVAVASVPAAPSNPVVSVPATPGNAVASVAADPSSAVASGPVPTAAPIAGSASDGQAPQRLVVETSFGDGAAPQRLPTAAQAGTASPRPVSYPVASPVRPAGRGGQELADPSTTAPPSVAPEPSPSLALASAPPPGAASASGFWLQFGAFASADGARAALERFRRELAWLGAPFDVRREGTLYKVQAGPWPERAHALDAAARIRSATTLQPFAILR